MQHHTQGRLSEAKRLYEDILQSDPKQPEVLRLLGVIAHQVGDNKTAVEFIKKAIDLKPDSADAHNNLGIALKELGKLDEAIASYHKAIAIKPDHAVSHCNLGNALKELGKLDEAVSCYREAVTQDSNLAEAHNNLGIALRDQRKPEEAFGFHRRAIALDRQNKTYWKNFADTIKNTSFTAVDDDLWQDLLHLLDQSIGRLTTLVRPILSALYHRPIFLQVLELTESKPFKLGDGYADIAEQLSTIPLFLRLLEVCPITDLRVEKMLTSLRCAMIEDVMAGKADGKCSALSVALALQCFTNEYAFFESDTEKASVESLQQKIGDLVENDHDVPPSHIAALAAYKGLFGFPWAQKMCEREWGGNINEVIKRQIMEPRKETVLRSEIPRLSVIENTTSQSVRDQYEENPYPRWIRCDTSNNTDTIERVLQRAPLYFDLGSYISPERPEILIAGCGTGQHALHTATRFSHARVLALDLSLSSLSYAQRKTDELGISNIEYVQGDIMELSVEGRQFDLIESVGVLHHMQDPLAGWQILTNLLRPKGLMRIGLYSEIARWYVVQARAMIAEKKYTTSPEDMRRCRRDIIDMASEADPAMVEVCAARDFFSLSACRDLLFHVQEHRFSLPQIEKALQTLELTFLGFEMDDAVRQKFRQLHPNSKALTSLSFWHEFERQNPKTFRGMYQFWCQKR